MIAPKCCPCCGQIIRKKQDGRSKVPGYKRNKNNASAKRLYQKKRLDPTWMAKQRENNRAFYQIHKDAINARKRQKRAERRVGE